MFHLALALFDSACDEPANHEDLDSMIRALHPTGLERRLDGRGEPLRLLPRCDAFEPLIDLVDRALLETGELFSDDRQHLATLAGMLKVMYESEVGIIRDPFAAKELPFVFVGMLSRPDERLIEVLRALAAYLWLIDDWIDLPHDVHEDQPNTFATAPAYLLLGPLVGVMARRRIVGAYGRLTRSANRAGGSIAGRVSGLLHQFTEMNVG